MKSSLRLLGVLSSLILVQALPAANECIGNDNSYIRLESVSPGVIRARVSVNASAFDYHQPGALLPSIMQQGATPPSSGLKACSGMKISSAELSVSVSDATGLLIFTSESTGSTLLQETHRAFGGSSSGYSSVETASHEADCSGGTCCLDLYNWHTQPHSVVSLSNCHPSSDGDNQQWTLDSETGLLRVKLDSTDCLAESETISPGPAGKHLGAHTIEVNACNASDVNQIWNSNKGAAGSQYCLRKSGLCLAADADAGSSFGDGTPVALLPSNSTDTRQGWNTDPVVTPPSAQVDFSLPDRVLGFGQHQNGRLDSRGLAFDMESCLEYSKSHGGEVCLPFITGWMNSTNSPQYGFLWNMPSYGGVSFGATQEVLRQSEAQDAQARHHSAVLRKGMAAPGQDTMTWTAAEWQQYEIVVMAPASASDAGVPVPASSILERFGTVVGTAPTMPKWALGYWHSKNRYTTQSSFEEAVQGFVSRDIPIGVAVIDYNHWVHMGDWTFDPAYWPNPKEMVQNISSACEPSATNGRSTGDGERCVRIMVSAWPFTASGSDTYDYVQSAGLGVKNSTVPNATEAQLPPIQWPDPNCHDPKCWLYDPTHDAARAFYWSRLDAGYYDNGIDIFWLDASEPEIVSANGPPEGTQYSIGNQNKVGMMFPFWHTLSVQEGLHLEGKEDVVTITRSAWAGQARHAAATWSGDTQSTFASLAVSVPAGLNAQLSGISWWTLDIGGYSGGNPSDPTFNRLIVRWFEFGLTLPIFRQHGQRDTEPWLLSNHTSYELVVQLIKTRYSLTEFVSSALNQTAATMLPIMRPLPWDFPGDPDTGLATAAEGAYLFGEGLLARPIVEDNTDEVAVYLPKGPPAWIDCASGKSYPSGQTVTIPAPLGTLPLLKRSDMAASVDALIAAGVAKYPGKALPAEQVCVPGSGVSVA